MSSWTTEVILDRVVGFFSAFLAALSLGEILYRRQLRSGTRTRLRTLTEGRVSQREPNVCVFRSVRVPNNTNRFRAAMASCPSIEVSCSEIEYHSQHWRRACLSGLGSTLLQGASSTRGCNRESRMIAPVLRNTDLGDSAV